jgi:hypothetical protein
MTDAAWAPRRSLSDWLLAGEALAWLVLAAIAVRGLSFGTVVALVSGRAAPDRPLGDKIDRVVWAIDTATLRAPWHPKCFERGLAACCMLRRRGARPTLYYGARSDPSLGPKAHVWVRLAGRDVVGCEEAGDFALLATFPPRGQRDDQIGDPTP